MCSCSNSPVCEEYRRDANQGMRSNIAKRQTSFWNSKGTLVSVWLTWAKSPFAPASCPWQWCLRRETRHGASSVWDFPRHVLPASASYSRDYISIFGFKKPDGLLLHEFSLGIQLFSIKCIYFSFFLFKCSEKENHTENFAFMQEKVGMLIAWWKTLCGSPGHIPISGTVPSTAKSPPVCQRRIALCPSEQPLSFHPSLPQPGCPALRCAFAQA